MADYDPNLKSQMDSVFAKYGKTPTDADYQQWIGPGGYVMKNDVNGQNQVIPAWNGGELDPYWQYRMGLHATGQGMGTSATAQQSYAATPSQYGYSSYDQPESQALPYSFESNDPFASMGGGVWIQSTQQWVPRDHPLAQQQAQQQTQPTQPLSGWDAPAPAPAPQQPASTSSSNRPPDPFASMGGGVWIESSQQWVPRDHPLATGEQPASATGGTPPPSAPSNSGPTSPDPFASMGGGVWIPSTQQWVPRDHPLAQTGGAQWNGPGGLTGGGSAVVPGQPLASAGDIDQAARDQIMDLLRTPRNIDPKALRDTPEMQAVYLASQRAEERDRAALAERAAAEGWSGSGGFESGLQALREQRGGTEMQMMSQLATQYMERNREDIKAGIEFALNSGQFDKAQGLQRELAELNAAIEREKIAANQQIAGADNALGYERLGLDRDLGFADIDLKRYIADMGSAYDYANLEYTQNRDLMDWYTKNKPSTTYV